MKASVYLSAIAIIFLTACSTTRTGSVATDDIYYTPGDQTVIVQERANNAPSDNYRNDNYNNNDYSNYSDSYRDGGNTYINNYYDYNDYHYTSRLRRFYNPYSGFSYYSGIYTDYYWYTRNPVYYGVNISIGWGTPFYHPYHTYYGYTPYYPYYNTYPFGYHHHHHYPSYGYYGSPFGSPYGNPYGNYYGGNYGNDYNPVGNTNRYYGPRNTTSSNTGGGSRTSEVSYGKNDGRTGVAAPDKNISAADRVSKGTETRTENQTISNTGTISDSRAGEKNNIRTGAAGRTGQSINDGRAGVSADRNSGEGSLSSSNDRMVIEDRPRTYRTDRDNSIYAPQDDRQRNTISNTERYIENGRTDRSGYERERYVPSTERSTNQVQQQRSNNNYEYQPRINTDTRENRNNIPQNERIYVPRQREAAPQRQSVPQQREASPRRIERRSNPAPQREATPSPSIERRGTNSGSDNNSAAPSRSGSKSSENSGRRGR